MAFQGQTFYTKDGGQVYNVNGDQHNHHEHYPQGAQVNKIDRVENANFGTNYGTISQSSGGPRPPPPHYGGYGGPPDPQHGHYGPSHPPRGHGHPSYDPRWDQAYGGPQSQGWDDGYQGPSSRNQLHRGPPQGYGNGYEPRYGDEPRGPNNGSAAAPQRQPERPRYAEQPLSEQPSNRTAFADHQPGQAPTEREGPRRAQEEGDPDGENSINEGTHNLHGFPFTTVEKTRRHWWGGKKSPKKQKQP